MKIKHIIALFIFGFVFTVLGALFKIQHWMYAAELVTIGSLLKTLAAVILTIKLLTTNKFKDFLNINIFKIRKLPFRVINKFSH